MSDDNADEVRAIYARFREGDFRSSVGVLDPCVVFMPLRDSPEAELCFGAEGLAAWMRGLFESFTNLTMEALEFTASGDTVMVDVRQRGLARVSGVPSDTRYYTLWSF